MAKKKIPESICGTMLIYYKDNILYYSGTPTYIEIFSDFVEVSDHCASFSNRALEIGKTIISKISNLEVLDNIVLDDTTMKRIAKFNKNQEIKRLDKTIQEKQEKIKELEDILCDREKRVNKLKDFIKNIYDIDLDEDDYDEDYDW